jgi:hypothetical protein
MPRTRTVSNWLRIVPLGLGVLAGLGLSATGRATELGAGSYLFSDELGGFRLLAISGSGTPADPIVLVEEIEEAVPVTLVVRRLPGTARTGKAGFSALTLEKVVINRSERVWAGFEIELQEILGRPSVYTDGLSFNQLGAVQPDVSSDSFAENNRLFEPYDRIRFQSGFVDPDATARFKITITDPTPDLEFYIVQDPKLLSAGLPHPAERAVLPERRPQSSSTTLAASSRPMPTLKLLSARSVRNSLCIAAPKPSQTMEQGRPRKEKIAANRAACPSAPGPSW